MSGEATDPVSAYDGEWHRPTVFYNRWVKYLVYLAVVAFLAWNVWAVRLPFERIVSGLAAVSALLGAMFPPDFGVTLVVRTTEVAGLAIPIPVGLEVTDAATRLWSGLVETVAMSIVATVAGVVVSVPIAIMAAENLVPRPVYYVGRGLISISRALHELIVGIIVVVGVGFGALAGVIALVWATPGFLAKLLAEDLEDIDRTQVEAVRSTGASPLQVLLFAVVPQVMPRFIGLTIYRWDINVRAATILGVVGAGGIGNVLLNSFERYDYAYSMGIIVAIIAVVMVGEIASAAARRRVQ